MACLDLVHLAVPSKAGPYIVVQVSYKFFSHDKQLYHKIYLKIYVLGKICYGFDIIELSGGSNGEAEALCDS
jgi:hypothetical protein